MKPHRTLNDFRLREIEQLLTAELQTSREQLSSASTQDEKRRALDAHLGALHRFTEFATNGKVPKDLLPT
jgi:hypothetical protein